MATHRPHAAMGQRPRRLLVYVPILLSIVVAAAVAVLLLTNRADSASALDDDLCPTENARISESVTLLLDMRKPLDQHGRLLLADALRTVTQSMGANAELRTFMLADDATVARQPIGRLCKPYDNAELAVAEGGTTPATTQAPTDCDSLPAQLAAPVRDVANQFCTRRAALRQRIEEMIAPPQQPVANAFLVEALEEASLAFADGTPTSPPRSLYVFSDMAQLAPWYSHWALGAGGWSFDEFRRLREGQTAVAGPPPPSVDGVATTIFYVPRQGATDQPQARQAHQDFWRRYLASAFGSAPTFHDQPVMPMYEWATLADEPTAAELAAQERLQVQQQREEAERLLAQINEEMAALEESRRNADEERQRQERAAELRRQQAEAEAQVAEAEAAQIAASQGQDATDAATPSDVAAIPPTNQAPAAAIGDALGAPVASRADDAIQQSDESDQAAPSETEDAAALQPPDAGAAFAGAPTDAPTPPAPLAANVDQAPPRPIADQSANPVSGLGDGAPPCEIQLGARYRDLEADYPSIRNRYSTASIVVRFVVDDSGQTVDNEVAMVTEGSTAEPPQFLEDFGESAVDLVRLWRFDFLDENDENCTKRQERTTRLDFTYR